MAREKQTRNHSGSIFKRQLKRGGKTVTVFDARKRYKDRNGEDREKSRRCASQQEAAAALVEFQNQIDREMNILNNESLIEFFVEIRTGKTTFAEFRNFVENIKENHSKAL